MQVGVGMWRKETYEVNWNSIIYETHKSGVQFGLVERQKKQYPAMLCVVVPGVG